MTPKLLLAALLLASTPCAFSQAAPAPSDQNGPPPPPMMRRGHDKQDGGQHMREGGMPGREMRGPMGDLLPPGAWWRNADVVTRIGLTPDQVKRIDDIFLQSRVQLIHMHASLEEEQLMLEPLLNANPVDQGKALAQISKIADTRADVEKADAKMLLGIRGVLNADQWTKLRATHPRGPHGDRGGPGGPEGQHGPMMRGQRAPGGPSEPMGVPPQ
jgi:Spy/CpxP family protein refolding chaperone